MAKYLCVFPDKNKKKRDGWNWHVAETRKGRINVLYTAQGYNSKQIAMRRAVAHNKTLKKPLKIIGGK